MSPWKMLYNFAHFETSKWVKTFETSVRNAVLAVMIAMAVETVCNISLFTFL